MDQPVFCLALTTPRRMAAGRAAASDGSLFRYANIGAWPAVGATPRLSVLRMAASAA